MYTWVQMWKINKLPNNKDRGYEKYPIDDDPVTHKKEKGQPILSSYRRPLDIKNLSCVAMPGILSTCL